MRGPQLNMIYRVLYLGLGTLLVASSACTSGRSQNEAEAPEQDSKAVLYAEDFDSYEDGELPHGWWLEGGEAVYIEDGRLVIKADPETERAPGHAATVWNKNQFSGNVQVEFDVHVVASSINVNNINFFLHYTHPGGNSTLYETRNFRLDGMYDHYHDLNGYIFTFVNTRRTEKDEARFRMRHCPGFGLMNENYAYHCHKGQTYHVTITKQGDSLSHAVDGTVYLQGVDEKYNWTEGLMGFRTFHTDLWIDNFKVTRPDSGR